MTIEQMAALLHELREVQHELLDIQAANPDRSTAFMPMARVRRIAQTLEHMIDRALEESAAVWDETEEGTRVRQVVERESSVLQERQIGIIAQALILPGGQHLYQRSAFTASLTAAKEDDRERQVLYQGEKGLEAILRRWSKVRHMMAHEEIPWEEANAKLERAERERGHRGS